MARTTLQFSSYRPDTPLTFKKICLFCGEPNDSINYTCRCKDKEWQKEYRALDVKMDMDSYTRARSCESFTRYDLDGEEGLLQYYALPSRQYRPENMEKVGLTPLRFLPELSNAYGVQLYIKNEGANPSGCFKDRETLMCLLNSRRRGLKRAVIYSSGNAAASAAVFAQKLRFHLVTFVPGDTYPEKTDFIRDHGSDVVVVGDESTNFETGFRLFARLNADGVFARNHFDNWSVRNPYRVQGDKTIALEIIKQLSGDGEEKIVPEYVVIPTANGSCMAGVWKGFRELKELGIIARLPKMVSAGIRHASPVYKAVQMREVSRPVRCDLSRLDPGDARIGSIILAEEGYDSIEAAKAVLESGGMAVEVTGADIRHTLIDLLKKESELVTKYAILPEPASLISIAAIDKIKEKVELSQQDRVVSVITGHGMKAKEMISDLLGDHTELKEMVQEFIDHKRDQIPETAKQKGKRVDVEADFDKVAQAFVQLKKDDLE